MRCVIFFFSFWSLCLYIMSSGQLCLHITSSGHYVCILPLPVIMSVHYISYLFWSSCLYIIILLILLLIIIFVPYFFWPLQPKSIRAVLYLFWSLSVHCLFWSLYAGHYICILLILVMQSYIIKFNNDIHKKTDT